MEDPLTSIAGLMDLEAYRDSVIVSCSQEPLDEFVQEQFYDTHEYLGFPFLLLPQELRVNIYKYILSPCGSLDRHDRHRCDCQIGVNHDVSQIFALTLTCRFLYEEIWETVPRQGIVHITRSNALGYEALHSALDYRIYNLAKIRPHPLVRRGRHMVGFWHAVRPSIPYHIAQQNHFRWKSLQMMVTRKMVSLHPNPPGTEEQRVRKTLEQIRETCRKFDDFVSLTGRGQGLSVSILIRIFARRKHSGRRILDRYVCSIWIKDAAITVVGHHGITLGGETLSIICKETLGLDASTSTYDEPLSSLDHTGQGSKLHHGTIRFVV